MERPETVEILGLRFDNLTRQEAAARIAALASASEKAYVVKPYSEFMTAAAGSEQLKKILNCANLCLPDGVGIQWAAHYLSLKGRPTRALMQLPLSLAAMIVRPSALRQPIREVMAGVDLTWAMLGELERVGASVFLLGGTKVEVVAAQTAIAERLPSLRLVGSHDGHFSVRGQANDAVVVTVNAVKPDILLVAMGFPRQERWIVDNIDRLDVRVAVAEGGSFSFIGGNVSRAPGWMRRAGLEWLYRLGRQPWRLKRQMALPRFVWLVVQERLRRAG